MVFVLSFPSLFCPWFPLFHDCMGEVQAFTSQVTQMSIETSRDLSVGDLQSCQYRPTLYVLGALQRVSEAQPFDCPITGQQWTVFEYGRERDGY